MTVTETPNALDGAACSRAQTSQTSPSSTINKTTTLAASIFISIGIIALIAVGVGTGGLAFIPAIIPISGLVIKALLIGGLFSTALGISLFVLKGNSTTPQTLPPPPPDSSCPMDASPAGVVKKPVYPSPVGISNTFRNCWLIATLQFYLAVPLLRNLCKSVEQRYAADLKPLNDFFDLYDRVQLESAQKKSWWSSPPHIPVAECQKVRKHLSTLNHTINPSSYQQGTVEVVLQMIKKRLSGVQATEIQAYTNKAADREQPEWKPAEWSSDDRFENDQIPGTCVNLSMSIDDDHPPALNDVFASYLQWTPLKLEKFCGKFPKKRIFSNAPEDLFITGIPRGLKPSQSSFRLHLDSEHVATKKEAYYIPDAFIVGGGNHFVTYRRSPDGTWFLCNDGSVSKISEDIAASALANAYIIHCHKESASD